MRRSGSSVLVSAVIVFALTFSGVSVTVVSAVSASVHLFSNADVAARFEAFLSEQRIDPALLPAGVNPARMDTVMIKLHGDPVAVVEGNLGAKLSSAGKDAIKAELRAQQDALKPLIASLGGTVLGQYQVVYNGMRVQIPHSSLVSLAAVTSAIYISPLGSYEPDNTNSIPLIGAPAVWDATPGFRGENIKIGIIDTGIDYTHANFGGPGTPDAYTTAHATETAPADPSMFGPSAPKVKGGIDLVGDAYNGNTIPMPDPNPLDCNGHGSHVAGTAAGFGVLSSGSTFTGPYTSGIYAANSFEIGPGVAPLADLYAIRVFGCSGFTNVVVDALEWAVDNDMDVVNMSLGAVFGTGSGADQEASNNAARAGVIVVAAAGNAGPGRYIVDSPSTADLAISVAANEAIATVPGATSVLSTGPTITMQNSNGAPFTDGTGLTIKVLKNADGTVSLGCNPAEYTDVTGKLVVTARGTCARVARAVFGQQAGAAAVAMINNAGGYPPYEDTIRGNPDTGEQYLVTIPFFGALRSDGASLLAADGGTVTLTNTIIANPNFEHFASFSSGGPRGGDSVLKPDITAPGVSTKSTAIGTGNLGVRFSGTSMATPHVSGVAALVREAHPSWRVSDIKAAIVNTGDPSGVADYSTSRGGTGLVQAPGATQTGVIAYGDRSLVSLSFGFAELSRAFVGEQELTIRNRGKTSATFTISAVAGATSAPHTISLSKTTITVRRGDSKDIDVTLQVPAATVGDSSDFREVVGLIVLTPVGDSNGGISLRVPYYLVPRALSNVNARLSEDFGPDNPTGTVTLTNRRGAISGDGDFYAWGLAADSTGVGPHDVRAVGVQTFPFPSGSNPTRHLIVFAVNTWTRWSSASVSEFDIFLDVNGDGVDDYAVVGFDLGAILTGSFNGQMGAFVFNLATNAVSINFLAYAPTDSSTILLPILSSRIGISPANPRFSYHVVSYSIFDPTPNVVPGLAMFNVYNPAISNGDFVTVAPGGTGTSAASIDTTEWANTPALGIMIVIFDNAAGSGEARLLAVHSGDSGESGEH